MAKDAAGGYLVGRSHANGGIKAINKATGQPLEMEGGEVIITKPAVDDTSKYEFEGQRLTNRQILSKINEGGGGVSFADGGEIPDSFMCCGNSYQFGGETLQDYDIIHKIAQGGFIQTMTINEITNWFMGNGTANNFLNAEVDPEENCLVLEWGKYGYGADEDSQEIDYEKIFRAVQAFNIDKLGAYFAILEKSDTKFNRLYVFTYPELAKNGHFYEKAIGNSKIHQALIASGNTNEAAEQKLADATKKQDITQAVIQQVSALIATDAKPYLNTIGYFGGIQSLNKYGFEVILQSNRYWSSGKTAFNNQKELFDYLTSDKFIQETIAKIARFETAVKNTVYFGPDFFNLEIGKDFWHPKGVNAGYWLVRLGNVQAGSIIPTEENLRNVLVKTIENLDVVIKYAEKKPWSTKQFKQGGEVDGINTSINLAPDERKLLYGFNRNPDGINIYYSTHLDSVANLMEQRLVEVSPFSGALYIGRDKLWEIRPTLKGQAFAKEYPFEPEDELEPVIYKKGGTIAEQPELAGYNYFKGLKHAYTNPYELNKAIEEVLDRHTDADFDSDMKSFIKNYSGYGGLTKYMDSITSKDIGVMFEYFTPDEIVKRMWGLAYKYGYNDGPVLEPSCGVGAFIEYAPTHTVIDGYEINKYSARICKLLYPHANISTDNFEKIFIKNNDSVKSKTHNLKKYSLVIGNPPYGTFSGRYSGMGEAAYTKAKNYIEYFIFRGLDLLQPGGLLIYIIGAEVANGGMPFLDQQNNKVKEAIAEKADLVDAFRLPNGVFDRTDVLSDILVIRKK